MKEAYDAQAQARAAALEQMLRMYDGQNALIGQQHDQAARDAYANARISAIGNNEALAAQGLAGGLYQNPTSGMSETSRVAQDNALRSNLLSVQIARPAGDPAGCAGHQRAARAGDVRRGGSGGKSGRSADQFADAAQRAAVPAGN